MKNEKVFPSFRRQNKWLGIIDYKSLFVFGTYLYIIYLICIGLDLNTRLTGAIIIVATVPLVAIYFVNSKEESIADILYVVIKFYLSKKKYYYKIRENEEFDIAINKKIKHRVSIDNILKKLKI